jgi:DNA-binding NarL/FixJ family response regulator
MAMNGSALAMTPHGNGSRPLVVILDECTILSEALRDRLAAQSNFRVELVDWERLDNISGTEAEIVLFDPRQASPDTASAIEEVRERLPDVRLLAYCSVPELDLAAECMRLGLDGFISKGAVFEQLRSALSIVACGGVYIDRSFGEAVLSHSGIADGPPCIQSLETSEKGMESLSEREAVVLKLICQGFSPKQIAADLGISRKTVDTYRTRGMRKLDLADRSELVRYAIDQGWIA